MTLPDGWTCVREQPCDNDAHIYAYLRMDCPPDPAWSVTGLVPVHASSLAVLVGADGKVLDWRYRP